MGSDDGTAVAQACATARAEASACCDGEAARTPALERHLAGCEECRAFAAALPRLRARLHDLADAAPAHAGFAALGAQLLARAAVPAGPRRLRGAWTRLAAGIAGLVAVGVPALLARPPPPAASAHQRPAWLEALDGRALLPADAPFDAWRAAVAEGFAGTPALDAGGSR